jgi:hypothetical protein
MVLKDPGSSNPDTNDHGRQTALKLRLGEKNEPVKVGIGIKRDRHSGAIRPDRLARNCRQKGQQENRSDN